MKSNSHRFHVVFGCVFVFLLSATITAAFPVLPEHEDSSEQSKEWRTVVGALVAVALVLCAVVVTVQCLCCEIKPRRPSVNCHDRAQSLTPVRENGASSTEFTIFPPIGSQQLVDVRNNDDVKFEPLPDIHPRRLNSVPTNQKPRPATFSNVVTKGLSLRDWFEDPHSNFPRTQLQYVRELGSGWFGQVVEGEAYGIIPTQRKTKVVVKILMEGANTTDQMYFLHEVKPFRDLDHPNVLKLLGKCLESDPFLIILEHCAFKDLKSYLIHHRTEAESLFNQNLLLRMVCNVASGLLHAHNHGFVLTDLAARNCVVSADLVVKIGDYGNSIELYKDDYYCAGGIAVPVRWCAPETLRCTETIMETREVTQEANIWSFGVVLWEILEFGKLPYIELNDDELIQKVIIDRTEVLKRPLTPYSHVNRLYQIIQLCQLSPTNRPSMEKIHAMLSYLYSYKMESADSAAEFDVRWNQLQPRKPQAKTSTSSPAASFMLDMGSPAYNSDGDSLLMRELSSSPNPSLSYDSDFSHPIIVSPSLQNLRGSLDDLRIEENSRKGDYASQDLIILPAESCSAAKDFVYSLADRENQTESVMSVPDAFSLSAHNTEVPSSSSSSLEVSNKVLDERSSSSSKEVSPFTREVQEVIRKLDKDLDEACPSLNDALQSSPLDGSLDPTVISEDTRMDNSLFGDESYLNSIGSEVEFDSLSHEVSGVVVDPLQGVKENSEEDEDDDLSWRKIVETSNEQSGEITRIIREKSQSVQDFLKLTVIDSESGSDSDGVSNIKNDSASSGEGDCSPKALRRQIQVRRRQSADDILLDLRGEEGRGAVLTHTGDGLTPVHAVTGPLPGSSVDPVHADAILSPGSIRGNDNISFAACTDPGDASVHQSLNRLADELVMDSLVQALPEVLTTASLVSSQTAAACAFPSDVLVDNLQNCGSSSEAGIMANSTPFTLPSTHCHVPQILVDEVNDPSDSLLEESDCVEELLTYRPKSGLNFRFVFKSLDDMDSVSVLTGVENVVAQDESDDTGAVDLETSADEFPPESVVVDSDVSLPLKDSQPLPTGRTSTPHSRSSDEDLLLFASDSGFELDVFAPESEMQVVPSDSRAISEVHHDAVNLYPEVGTAAATDGILLPATVSSAQNELLHSPADDRDSSLGEAAVPLVTLSDGPSPPAARTVLNDGVAQYCGCIVEQNNLRTANLDEVLLDGMLYSVAEQNSSSSSGSLPPSGPSKSGSDAEGQLILRPTNADEKLIDFDEISSDGGLLMIVPSVSSTGTETAFYKVKEVSDVIDGLPALIPSQNCVEKIAISDKALSPNAETDLLDIQSFTNGDDEELFSMERRCVPNPDVVIDSAFAYLGAVGETDDIVNGNLMDCDSPSHLIRPEDCGALKAGCSSPSPSTSVQKMPHSFLYTTSSETKETDTDCASLDEGFEPSESSEFSQNARSESISSSSEPNLLVDDNRPNESAKLLPSETANNEDSHLMDSNSSLYSADEDCIMLVDLETNEAILMDQPKSKLSFAQGSREKYSDDTNGEDSLSSSSVSSALLKNDASHHRSSTKETSASVELEENVLDEDFGESLATSSKSKEADSDYDCGTVQSSCSSGCQPSRSDCSSEATSASISPSNSKESDASVASDWQFISEESQSGGQVSDKSSSLLDGQDVQSSLKVSGLDPKDVLAEATPELLFLMQLTSKIEKLGLKSSSGDSGDFAALSAHNLPSGKEDQDSEGKSDGCVPPTSSPTNGPCAVANERLLSPQWETSTDTSSSPSGCHSPSSASSTSGEFDCSKDFKFESFKVQEAAAIGDDNDEVGGDDEEEEEEEEEEENEEEEEEEGHADDEGGGYSDDEEDGGDEQSLIDSFKASTWDKDATPTKGLLRSPDKQYQSEGKKTVSFKLQKKSVIYEYPKEEVEDEEMYDPRGVHSVWTYHMYNPELDYSRYADWDLEEAAPDNVEIEEFDEEGSSESSSDFMGQPRHPDQAHALYKLSDIPDDELASDYSSEGGNASYYAHPDSFDFASYLDHYNGSPLYSGMPSKNQDDEDFWLETILNSSDFFVSGTDCPFVFHDEDGEEGKGLPQWALSPGTFNMYVDMQNGSDLVNGSSHQYELENGQDGDDDEEDDDGEHVHYEREGHVSRMGEYKEVDNEDEDQLDDEKDGRDGPWDDIESGESTESVAMETDSTDDNLDEVKADRKVANLINNNLLPSVVSDVAKTSNEMKPLALQVNGTENGSKDDEVSNDKWNGSSGKSTEDDIINRGASQLETVA